MPDPAERREGWSWWYLLFVVQYVAVLWPPFYNSAEPYWLGIPFFYWYQLLWVLIGAVFTVTVYFATRDRWRSPRAQDSGR
jgi:hypothetical protein